MKSILVSLLLTTSAFLFYGCEGNNPRVEKPLKIKMVNDKPCFYIDPFEDMDRFVIRNISVDHIISPLTNIENQWHEGEFDIMRAEAYNRPIGQRYLFTPSAMAGSDKCVEYGTDLDKNVSTLKKLKTGVIYSAECVGYNKKEWMSAKEEVGKMSVSTLFYLQKNQQTGRLEAVIVKGNNQAIK